MPKTLTLSTPFLSLPVVVSGLTYEPHGATSDLAQCKGFDSVVIGGIISAESIDDINNSFPILEANDIIAALDKAASAMYAQDKEDDRHLRQTYPAR